MTARTQGNGVIPSKVAKPQATTAATSLPSHFPVNEKRRTHCDPEAAKHATGRAAGSGAATNPGGRKADRYASTPHLQHAIATLEIWLLPRIWDDLGADPTR